MKNIASVFGTTCHHLSYLTGSQSTMGFVFVPVVPASILNAVAERSHARTSVYYLLTVCVCFFFRFHFTRYSTSLVWFDFVLYVHNMI